MKRNLFLDCDGVLADFDKKAAELFGMHPRNYEEAHGAGKFWSTIHRCDDFFYHLELMPDAMELYNAVKHLKPTILTAVPNGDRKYTEQKIRWAAKHFGADQKIITCASKEKSLHAEAGDVIVDDWPKHRPIWEAKGGIWVLHTSAADSINQLKELKIL